MEFVSGEREKEMVRERQRDRERKSRASAATYFHYLLEIVLGKRPLKEVVVHAIDQSNQVQIYPSRLVFDPFNYADPQVVRVVARDDERDEALTSREPCIITHQCVSSDPEYSGGNVMIKPDQVGVKIIDNDAPYLFSFGDGANGKLGNIGNRDQVVDVPRFVSIMSGGELKKMATISGASIKKKRRRKKKKKNRNRLPSEDEEMWQDMREHIRRKSTVDFEGEPTSPVQKPASFRQQDIQSAIVNEEDE